jgi:hypothetical protein
MSRYYAGRGLANVIGGLLLTVTAHAAPIVVHIDTSSASGDATMFFDFTDGDGVSGNNSVTILSFATDGVLQNDESSLGDATGSIASLPITLADALASFSSYSQSLTLGAFIDFSYEISGTGAADTPDAFAFSLLDSTFNSVLPTSNIAGALLVHSIGNPDQPEIFADSVTTRATSVPEPGSAPLVLFAIFAAASAGRRFRRVNPRAIAATLRGGRELS